MKALILFYAVFLVLGTAAVNAAPGNGCDQIEQRINDVSATIDQNATAYWMHRANFVDLIYGPSSEVVPNARALAEQEKAEANSLKAGMPNNLASLKGLAIAAEAQNCPAQLPAIAEPRIKLAKRVNFDQFPPEESLEEATTPGPHRMPH
ncbi:MAG TPA: hypothetical protein VJ770_13930 [Stellaceae bacterium]|nr:hypothetical protein [Stellaceae bacterium]